MFLMLLVLPTIICTFTARKYCNRQNLNDRLLVVVSIGLRGSVNDHDG